MVIDAWVGAQVGADLCAGTFGQCFGDGADRVAQIAEADGVVALFAACLGAGRLVVAAVNTVDAEGAGLDAAFAARRDGFLLRQVFMDEGAAFVGAGQYAVAAADAAVAVYQDDAVGAFERGAGGADINAGRVVAVLAGQRQ